MSLKVTFVVFYIFIVYEVLSKPGPYRTVTDKITAPCPNPQRPYENTPSIILDSRIFNASSGYTFIDCNLTVIQQHKYLKSTVKVFALENGKWKLRYFMNNFGCRSAMAQALLKLVGLDSNGFDVETCSFPKGFYHTPSVDLNFMDHVFVKEREPGRIMWKFELHTREKTILCLELESSVIPA